MIPTDHELLTLMAYADFLEENGHDVEANWIRDDLKNPPTVDWGQWIGGGVVWGVGVWGVGVGGVGGVGVGIGVGIGVGGVGVGGGDEGVGGGVGGGGVGLRPAA